MRFHEDLRRRDQQIAEFKAKIEALIEQNEHLKSQLMNAPHCDFVGSDSMAGLPQPSSSNPNGTPATAIAHNGYGNESAIQSSSVVEVRIQPQKIKLLFFYPSNCGYAGVFLAKLCLYGLSRWHQCITCGCSVRF